MDILKRLLWLLLILVLLVPLLLAYFVMTDSGLQRMVSMGRGFLGDDLQVGSVEGKLIGPASINDFQYKSAGTEISVDSLSYDWHPGRLFSKELNVERLNIKGVTIRLPVAEVTEDAESKEPFQLKDLKIPFSLKAKDLSITDVALYPPGAEEPLVIDEILLHASGEGDAISELELSIDAPLGNLFVDGMLNTSGDWPISVDTNWNFNHQQFGTISGEGAATGDFKAMQITHKVSGLVDAALDVEVFDVLSEPTWDGRLTADSDNLGIFSESLTGVPINVDVDTKGSLAQFAVDGKVSTGQANMLVDADVFDVTSNVSWDGSLKLDSENLGEFSEALKGVPVNANIDTKGSLDELTLDGTITSGQATVLVDAEVFDVSGDISWDANLKANSEDLGEFSEGLTGVPIDVDIDTKGSLATLTLDGTISSGLASVVVDAEVSDVTGNMSWDGTLKAKSEDLGQISEELAGVPVDIDVETTGSLENFTATGKLATNHELSGPVSTNFNVSGDLGQIVIAKSNVLFEQSPAEITYAGSVDLKSLSADMDIDWTELEYPVVADPKLVLSPEGSLKFTGSAEDYKVQLNTKVQQELAGDLGVELIAQGSTDRITLSTFSVDGPPTSINAGGVIDLKTRELDIIGDWIDVRWPLVGDEELVRSSKADFSVKGTLDDYQVDADLSLSGKDIPEGDWKLSTRGNTESLSDLSVVGNVLEGQVSATGDVVFSPRLQWDLSVSANNINLGDQWPEHEGKISLKATSNGSITDSGPNLVANIQSLSGNYRGQELGGGGSIAFADGNLTADEMAVRVGAATVGLNGALGDELDLKWNMNAEQLSDLVPGIKGDIKLEGNLSGTREEPRLQFDLSANDFQSGGAQANNIVGSGIIDISGNSDSKINITGESLKVASYRWEDIKVVGDGTPSQHQLSVSMAGDAPNVALDLKGGVDAEQWNGSLDKLELLKTPAGDWTLFEPVAMQATKHSAAINVLCLTNLPAVLCVDGKWQVDSGVAARVAIESFTSELYSDLMPPDIDIDAPISGTVDLTVMPGGKPNAIVHLDIPSGQITFESKGDLITAILGESAIDVVLDDDSVTTDVSMALGEIGTVNADVVVTDLYNAQNLTGEVVSEVQDISLAGFGSQQVTSIDGAFFSNLKLGGTLKAPMLIGDMNLEDFAAEVPSVSLKLAEGNIMASSDGNGNLSIQGQIKSGEGDLSIGGFFNPESGKMELELGGENFQVANADKQKAVISPDLQIKIDGENISVTGDLDIPSAFIAAGGESGVIAESSDVVVVKRLEDRVEEDDPTSRVELGVNVSLGDVRVSAGQFDGALDGELAIEQIPGKPPTGTGTIEVVSGDFLVYGQKLTMEKGNILFGGGPLDNPGLELDVARYIPTDEVTAGVKVRGTAQAPTLELQSDPEQTDANTLSYIVFGKPVGDGVSYTLGKFITPSLYVSYGIDLLDQVRTFNARYRITDTLAAVATSSSDENGSDSADLIYTIER